MKRLFTAAAIAVAFAAAPASAAMYQLHYTGTTDSTVADIHLSTSNTLNGAGGYDILSVSGNVNGDVITGLAPVNPPGFTTDNVYFNADPIFTSSGVGFFSATTTYNLWGNGPGSYSLYGTTDGGGSYVPSGDGTLSVAAVPEPATWGLMLVGFAMTGVAARRRSVAIAA